MQMRGKEKGIDKWPAYATNPVSATVSACACAPTPTNSFLFYSLSSAGFVTTYRTSSEFFFFIYS